MGGGLQYETANVERWKLDHGVKETKAKKKNEKKIDLGGIENHLKALNMWKFEAECRDRKKI